MSEQMLEFLKINGIESPVEIDSNPYEGLTVEEITEINETLKVEKILD